MNLPGRPLRAVIALAAAAVTFLVVPSWWCGLDASSWYSGDIHRQRDLARTVAAQMDRGLGTKDFFAGSSQFSGEWLFGTCLMAGLGFCQIVREHPETREEFTPLIERCIVEIQSPKVREFDAATWGNDALEDLENGRGHAAYLGYFNLLLAVYRGIDPDNRFVPLNDRISDALRKRLASSSNGLIETYPGEWYPVDNAPALASLVLGQKWMPPGTDWMVVAWMESYRRHAIDPATGLLFQALQSDGTAADAARGSGTALAAFFFGHGVPSLSRELYAAMQRELAVNIIGFGAMREYPPGSPGCGDIDSGPVIFGLGFSASGFAIGDARMNGDRKMFRRLWASAQFGGAPIKRGDRFEFVTGGPLGNAILLAMVTARMEGAR